MKISTCRVCLEQLQGISEAFNGCLNKSSRHHHALSKSLAANSAAASELQDLEAKRPNPVIGFRKCCGRIAVEWRSRRRIDKVTPIAEGIDSISEKLHACDEHIVASCPLAHHLARHCRHAVVRLQSERDGCVRSLRESSSWEKTFEISPKSSCDLVRLHFKFTQPLPLGCWCSFHHWRRLGRSLRRRIGHRRSSGRLRRCGRVL